MTGLLSGDEIREANLIQGPRADGFRAASYDLHIGQIIRPDGTVCDSYVLPPQGIVEVLATERVHLPPTIAGYALVKTSLCNEGLLALNIGVIDPGYQGKLSSAIVNFGKTERLLITGETFLRLTFHLIVAPNLQSPPTEIDDAEYLADKRRKVVAHFSASFLNLSEVIKKYTEEAFETFRNRAFVWVPLLAGTLALFTFLLNFGSLLLVQKWLTPSDSVRAELLQSTLHQRDDELTNAAKALSDRVAQIEQERGRLAEEVNQLQQHQTQDQVLAEQIQRLQQQVTQLTQRRP